MPLDRPGAESLVHLRHEIESVDRSIVLLLAARLDGAERAIRARVAHGRPVTDEAQEDRVLRRAREWARELGLPPALVDTLFRTLIAEGKARFRAADKPASSPFVTVLLAGPDGTRADVRNASETPLVAVSTSR